MSRGFVSIDPGERITVTPASKGAEMQLDLTVALGMVERMHEARNRKMLYGVVTAVEIDAMQRLVMTFAVEAQRIVNEEGMPRGPHE